MTAGTALALAAGLAAAGCAAERPAATRGAPPAAAATPDSPGTASPPTTTPEATRTTPEVAAGGGAGGAPGAAAAAARFQASVGPVTTAALGASWHPGCPVGPEQLRTLTVTFWGFDGQPHSGVLVANQDAVGALIAVFGELFRDRFPIRSIRPVADFGGSDDASAAADNTSAFNCRAAVATGPASWSQHAYGEAVDVNDVENPYVEGGRVIPPAGAAYTDRARHRPGMAEPVLVAAFARQGWGWGGRWTTPDYQHFSSNGR